MKCWRCESNSSIIEWHNSVVDRQLKLVLVGTDLYIGQRQAFIKSLILVVNRTGDKGIKV